MPVHIINDGDYELFVTPNRNRILSLDGERWFAWVEGRKGEILVLSDEGHEKARTEMRGHYIFVEFENDPTYRDIPHLFLQDGDRYHEMVVPQGLPEARNYQKKVIQTGNTIPKDELERYLTEPAPAGEGESRMARPRGGSMSNVVHYLQGIDLPADKPALIDYARQQGAPSRVVDKLRELESGTYATMADVMQAAAGTEHREDEGLPIENYNDLSAAEIGQQLKSREFSADEVRALHDYEQRMFARKTLMRLYDAYLEQGTTEGAKTRRRAGGASLANVARYLEGINLPASRADLVSHAERHGAPDEVLEKLRSLSEDRFHSMVDVTKAAARARTDEGLPVENYDDRRVAEIQRMLDQGRFRREQIEQLREYEARHRNRRTLMTVYDQVLKREQETAALPIPNYNELTIGEVKGKLGDLDEKEVEQLRRFEKRHKGRRTLLEAYDRKLQHRTRTRTRTRR